MSIFNFWKKENRGREFTEEEREKSHEIRKLNSEIRQLEKEKIAEEKRAELAEMREELKAYKRGGYDDEKGGAEDFFMQMLMQKFMGGSPQQQAQQIQEQEEIPDVELSDAEIDGMIKEFIPKRLKILAKILSAENCKRTILHFDEYGILNEANIEKIVKKLKG